MPINIQNLPDLKPGDNNDAVKQLQTWLNEQGANLPVTGFYGDLTKAALTQWQQQHGVQAGANFGYFGPLTRSAAMTAPSTSSKGVDSGSLGTAGALQQQGGGLTTAQAPTAPTQSSAPTAPQKPSAQQLMVNMTANGNWNSLQPGQQQAVAAEAQRQGLDITQVSGYPASSQTTDSGATSSSSTSSTQLNSDMVAAVQQWMTASGIPANQQQAYISQLNPNQLATLGLTYLSQQAQYANSASASTLATALQQAQNNPQILAKYGDAAAFALQNVQSTFSELQKATDVTASAQATQFKQDQIALAEQAAQAGQAYSGFRQQAEARLRQQEGGIVASTQSGLRQQVLQAGQAYQQSYGQAPPVNPISYTNPLTQGSESYGYSALPGITGTVPLQQQADITAQTQANIAAATPQVPTIKF